MVKWSHMILLINFQSYTQIHFDRKKNHIIIKLILLSKNSNFYICNLLSTQKWQNDHILLILLVNFQSYIQVQKIIIISYDIIFKITYKIQKKLLILSKNSNYYYISKNSNFYYIYNLLSTQKWQNDHIRLISKPYSNTFIYTEKKKKL